MSMQVAFTQSHLVSLLHCRSLRRDSCPSTTPTQGTTLQESPQALSSTPVNVKILALHVSQTQPAREVTVEPQALASRTRTSAMCKPSRQRKPTPSILHKGKAAHKQHSAGTNMLNGTPKEPPGTVELQACCLAGNAAAAAAAAAVADSAQCEPVQQACGPQINFQSSEGYRTPTSNTPPLSGAGTAPPQSQETFPHCLLCTRQRG